MTRPLRDSHYPYLLCLIFVTTTLWSAINPTDRFTWYLEVAPIPLGLLILLLVHFWFRQFELTSLSWTLLTLWAVVLLVGGHYTYAEVPIFNTLREILGTQRNSYDRLAHFVQGVVPAMLARDLLARYGGISKKGLLFFLSCCIALTVSATYELVEWWVSITTAYFTGEGADAFLGTQGDIWDTQWDMFMALSGSIASQLMLSYYCPPRWHQARLHDAVSP